MLGVLVVEKNYLSIDFGTDEYQILGLVHQYSEYRTRYWYSDNSIT
jgi:hypothetical protein